MDSNKLKEIYADSQFPFMGNRLGYSQHDFSKDQVVYIKINDIPQIEKELGIDHAENTIKTAADALRTALDSSVGRAKGKLFRVSRDEFYAAVPNEETAHHFVRNFRSGIEGYPATLGSHPISVAINIKSNNPEGLSKSLPHVPHSTQAPAFKQWFGDSKAVHPDGKPMVLFHGTKAPEKFKQFSVGEPRSIDDGMGNTYNEWGSGADPTAYLGSHFAEEHHVANKFANGLYSRENAGNEHARVYPVHLKVSNPKIYNNEHDLHRDIYQTPGNHHSIDFELEGHEDPDEAYEKYDNDPEFREEINRKVTDPSLYEDGGAQEVAQHLAEEFRNHLASQGYDGIKYANGIEGGTSWAVWNPNQIKSALGNNGMYSPDPDIAKSEPPSLASLGPEWKMYHVGRDFDQFDPNYIGTGEGGGSSNFGILNPLGPGLYGIVGEPGFEEEALQYAKGYSKYHDNPFLHTFHVQFDTDGTSFGSRNPLSQNLNGDALRVKRAALKQSTGEEYEDKLVRKLGHVAANKALVAHGITASMTRLKPGIHEVAIFDPSKLKRINKEPLYPNSNTITPKINKSENNLEFPDLQKMAIRDIPMGRKVGKNPQTGGNEFDYSHLLTPAHRAMGYKMHLTDKPMEIGEDTYPYFRISMLHNNNEIGRITGSLQNGNSLRYGFSELNDEHRGKGLGLAAYEAMAAHALHKHKAKFIIGDNHSSSASGTHLALSRRHGMGYTPVSNPNKFHDQTGDFDDQFAPYRYKIK